MKSSGICTNSCRLGRQLSNISQKDLSGHFTFDTKSNGLNQGAHNMTHSIAGSPLWDPNSPEALSSVVSDYRTSSFSGGDKKESYQFYSRIYHLFWKMFGNPLSSSTCPALHPWALFTVLGHCFTIYLSGSKNIHSFAFCQICMVVRPPQTQVKTISLEFDWYHVWPANVCEDFWAGKHLCNRALRIHVDLRAIHNAMMSTFISLFPLVQERVAHPFALSLRGSQSDVRACISYIQHAKCVSNLSDLYLKSLDFPVLMSLRCSSFPIYCKTMCLG